ncbi:hypothetical protein B484DRAFT_394687, partial [Ochromonadaceae sp. CCMP2298]
SRYPEGSVLQLQYAVLFVSCVLYAVQLVGTATKEWDKIVLIQTLSNISSSKQLDAVAVATPIKLFIFFTAEGEYIWELCCLAGGGAALAAGRPGLAVLRGGLLLMLIFFYSSFVLGTSLWIETGNKFEECQSFSQCTYTLLRLTFYDGTGFDFAYKLTDNHAIMFYVCIIYMAVTSFGILNGLVGIFGTLFAIASEEAFNDTDDEDQEQEEGDMEQVERELRQEEEEDLKLMRSSKGGGTGDSDKLDEVHNFSLDDVGGSMGFGSPNTNKGRGESMGMGTVGSGSVGTMASIVGAFSPLGASAESIGGYEERAEARRLRRAEVT